MALIHVDRTGNPDVAWKYLIKSKKLGRSYALYATNVVCLASLGILGRFDSSGCRDIFQSRGAVDSRQPVSTAVPFLPCRMTASRVKVTSQSASYRGPTPIKVWWKPGIRCPLIGNSDGIWGKAKSPIPAGFFFRCCTHCDPWSSTVYVDYRGIGVEVYVGGARVYNSCGFCWECTMLVCMGPVGFNLVYVW